MPDEVMTMEQRCRDRARREQAFTTARDLLWGMEYEVEDVLVVADWLLDGRAALALKISQQTADNYGRHRDDEMPDAARWTPPAEVGDRAGASRG